MSSIATWVLNTLSGLNYSYIWDKIEAEVPFFMPW
jgi:hypothetical protein